ncbi:MULTISPECIES: ParA family protein [Xanthomonas]|uniref:ParA family protein n=1 Tax=Xanthomonas TaxID=338 RepID=UPI0011B09C15|nr:MULTISPECIES: AAA family ATPase [Xanthomonas]NIJ77730.1 cellulose biosynthesis protein BcsQ [Xanthomonas sp. CFBP 8151]UOS99143.1 AAA family ATPase [Xanthomonas arboricola]CAG2098248.1 AAA family ATPase [Xanthomonas arboricola pv. juglandis]
MSFKKIALFNNKGGVGKTTITVNLATAIAKAGAKVLMVDADPQCNLSAFCLEENELDNYLRKSEEDKGSTTIWDGIKPIVLGRGDIAEIDVLEIYKNVLLLAGDVLISQYEEELPAAWTDSFARKSRGYDVMGALSRLVNKVATDYGADYVLFDVGPNVGPLNRAILLDSDYFLAPVGSDLFSLRALGAVGKSLHRWISDWNTVKSLASDSSKATLLQGRPKFLGYVASAYKVKTGGKSAKPHEHWESKIGPRVKQRVVDVLANLGADFHINPPYKLGEIKHFQSLAADAQKLKLPFSELKGKVNPGHNSQIVKAGQVFDKIAHEVMTRTGGEK